MFAEKYLKKQDNSAHILIPPSDNLGISVVIPCFREPEILKTLQSLHQCWRPESDVEVLILINHSEISDSESKKINQKTKEQIEEWIERNVDEKIKFFALGPLALKKKWAGAGVARKKGMDEAVRRFNYLQKPDGIIVSLDADTLVQRNYLKEIENHFLINRKDAGATISFEHQKHNLPQKHLQGIEYYEKYLEYYKKALEFTGYPYPMFTVGSAFAVTAIAYVKRGGMNRRQAGEDFYFLQGLVQIGNVGEITETKVFPSARISDRVPFGTGPMLKKWMNDEEDLSVSYNLNAFEDLKMFFDQKDRFFNISQKNFLKKINDLNESMKGFIKENNFWTEMEDLNKNCSNIKTFRNRFFQKFTAFKVLKFLNYAHENFYEKANLKEQLKQLHQKL